LIIVVFCIFTLFQHFAYKLWVPICNSAKKEGEIKKFRLSVIGVKNKNVWEVYKGYVIQ